MQREVVSEQCQIRRATDLVAAIITRHPAELSLALVRAAAAISRRTSSMPQRMALAEKMRNEAARLLGSLH